MSAADLACALGPFSNASDVANAALAITDGFVAGEIEADGASETLRVLNLALDLLSRATELDLAERVAALEALAAEGGAE
ncbi:MAG: hypothetical protein IPM29_20440 [Planctomycetes bacterium]|nr:hypothetical protein [Planctomycetota bacterium]